MILQALRSFKGINGILRAGFIQKQPSEAARWNMEKIPRAKADFTGQGLHGPRKAKIQTTDHRRRMTDITKTKTETLKKPDY
jgi:hypothetical protein